ncbi:MAG: hypothetical protein HKL96_04035 [Phycisphaerales bacterium]|nr:hypothetical protein [Phycisphaerales bacterium]
MSRTCRTASSERYILSLLEEHVASLDLHFVSDDQIEATLVVLNAEVLAESELTALLDTLHHRLFADSEHRRIRARFMVMYGKFQGEYGAGGT